MSPGATVWNFCVFSIVLGLQWKSMGPRHKLYDSRNGFFEGIGDKKNIYIKQQQSYHLRDTTCTEVV